MGAGVWSAQRLLVLVRVMDPGPPRDAAPCHLVRLTFLFQKWRTLRVSSIILYRLTTKPEK